MQDKSSVQIQPIKQYLSVIDYNYDETRWNQIVHERIVSHAS
jgi:hypothetical protein